MRVQEGHKSEFRVDGSILGCLHADLANSLIGQEVAGLPRYRLEEGNTVASRGIFSLQVQHACKSGPEDGQAGLLRLSIRGCQIA